MTQSAYDLAEASLSAPDSAPDNTPTPAAAAPAAPAPANGAKIKLALDFAANHFGVDKGVLAGMMMRESNLDPDVIAGNRKSSTGAVGLMQFMPGTAKRYGVDPTDPVQSIMGAAAYLKDNLKKFDGDYGKAIAGYDWGENRDTFNQPDWRDRLPDETKKYVDFVSEFATRLGSKIDASAPAQTPALGRGRMPLPTGVTPEPDSAGAGRGLGYQRSTGAGAIPTSADAAPGGSRDIAGAVPPAADPTMLDKLKGAGEAALSTATGLTTGFAGSLIAGGAAMGRDIKALATGEAPIPNDVEDSWNRGGQVGGYTPRTAPGTRYAEALNDGLAEFIPLMPMTGELAALHHGAAPVKTMVSDAARSAVSRVGDAAFDGAMKGKVVPDGTLSPAEQMRQVRDVGQSTLPEGQQPAPAGAPPPTDFAATADHYQKQALASDKLAEQAEQQGDPARAQILRGNAKQFREYADQASARATAIDPETQKAKATEDLTTATNVDDMIKAAGDLATRPMDDVKTATAQAAIDNVGSASYEAADQARLEKLRQAVDTHADLNADALKQANETERLKAEQVVKDQLAQDMPGRGAPATDVNALPEAARPEDLAAKQTSTDTARAGADLGQRFDGTPAPADPRLAPYVDLTPMNATQARQRLLVMRDQLRIEGGDPNSLVAAAHPEDKGTFAIKSLDRPEKLSPLTGEKAPITPPIDPVDMYVAAKRRENTPQARAFVQDFEAGRVTPDDVRASIARERAGAATDSDINARNAGLDENGRPGNRMIQSDAPVKTRGESPLRDSVIDRPLREGEDPAPEPAPPEPPAPPPEPAPAPTGRTQAEVLQTERNNPGLAGAVKARDFPKALEHLSQSNNPVIRRLAELGSKLKTTFASRKLAPSVGGSYVPFSDDIAISHDFHGDEHTVAHEIAHALLYRAIERPTPEQVPHVRKLEALRAHILGLAKRGEGGFREWAGGLGDYGLSPRNALHEFMSEALTNKDFQNKLAQVPYGKTSAWSKFVKFVGDALGLKEHTALHEVLQIGENLAETRQRATSSALTSREALEREAPVKTLPNGVSIHETDRGFEARDEQGNKVGYLHDNLQRGQAKQINENANIDMVKVNPELKGQGVGRALYEAFHDKHEGMIAPSGKTTPDAWAQWKRNYPDKVEDFARQEAGRILDGADPRVVRGNITDPEVANRVHELVSNTDSRLALASEMSAEERRQSEAEAPPERGPVTPESLSPAARAGADAPAPKQGMAAAKSSSIVRAKLGAMYQDLMNTVLPMGTGSTVAQAMAKTYANAERVARWQWQRFDEILKKNYTGEQLEKMWNAADEENLVRSGHAEAGPDVGLNRLTPDERATTEVLHLYGEQLLQRAKDAGIFKGEGLPYWTPRIAAMIDDGGNYYRPKDSTVVGRNIVQTAPSLKQRKYVLASDTEQAMKGVLGENAQLVRNIRAMPLAMARLERAIAGRELINSIKELGDRSGQDFVRETGTAQHAEIPLPGIAGQKIYVGRDFEGPMRALLYSPPGAWGKLFNPIKEVATSAIMYSPVMHDMVILGKALPYAWQSANPLMKAVHVGTLGISTIPKILSLAYKGYTLRDGEGAMMNPIMREAIGEGGMVPMGRNGARQDITGVVADPSLTPGQGYISKGVGGAVGLVNKSAGEMVKRGLDAAGKFTHETLLWNRIADLQVGLYADARSYMKDALVKKGLSEEAATAGAIKIAGHLANRYAGALPGEAMSQGARKLSNAIFFSRSFTLGNVGLIKDAVKGLPSEVRAQLQTAFGQDAADKVNGAFRSKARSGLMMDLAVSYIGASLAQSAYQYLVNDKSLDDITKGYLDRFHSAVDKVKNNPLSAMPFVGHPFEALHSLSSTGTNEPGKEGRIKGPTMSDGTATYFRLPLGKVGEDLEGWMSDPMKTFWKKSGTTLRPAVSIAMEAVGSPLDGKRIWAPSDSFLSAAGKAVAFAAASQVPLDDLKTVANMALPTPDGKSQQAQEQDALKGRKLLLANLAGVTVSRGYPGGPGNGVLRDVEQRQREEKTAALPEVNQLIKSGVDSDKDKAIVIMRDKLGMTPAQITAQIKFQTAPGARFNANRIRKDAPHMNEGDRARLDEAMQ